jgi:uncharacterized membrane protein
VLAYLSVLLISFIVSGLWVKYIQATSAERAEAAAVYDLLLMLAASGIYQIWAIQRNSFGVLVVGDVASALGTYAFIRVAKSFRSKKKSLQHANWGVKIMSRILGS